MTIRILFIKNLLNRNYTKTISKLDIVTALNELIYLILQNKARFILDRFHIFITILLFLLDCWCLIAAVNFRLTSKALYLNCTRDTSTTSSESHVVAAWNWKTIFTFYLNSILLFNLHKISDNELSFLDIILRVPDDHISTSVYCKETNTRTYLHHQSSHPSHCKTGLPRSQLLWLRHLCSK